MESKPKELRRHSAAFIDLTEDWSSNARDKRAAADILRELLVEPYEPLDETRLRVIEIQRKVGRFPRWDQAIFENLAELRDSVSKLEKQVNELKEMIQERAKIYGATMYELGDSQYELTGPIQIVIEEDEVETIARIPELNIYASADTDTEAINLLKREVVRLYEELENSDRKLGQLPRSWRAMLRRLIVKKDG
jgi:vacuolar-type H+-ATPase subunit I/STV1